MRAPRISPPVRLVAGYALAGTLWIVATETFSKRWGLISPEWLPVHIGKGLLFIGVTSVVLYIWARRVYRGEIVEHAALTREHARTEQSRRMYATLSAVNRRIIRPTDRTTLNQSICEALINPGAFHCAWIGRHDAASRSVQVLASAGVSLPARLAATAEAGAIGATLAEALRGRRPIIADLKPQDAYCTPGSTPHAEVRHFSAIPFQPESEDLMVLGVSSTTPGFFTAETMAMLAELAADVEYSTEVIAERERRAAAETALRASELRYRLLAEYSQDVIWIANLEGQLQYISPSVERLLEYTPTEMLELNIERFLTPASVEGARQQLRQVREELAQTGRFASRFLEFEQVRRDGTTVWTEVSVTTFHDEAGRPQGVLGVTRDMTKRRAAEQALAAEVARCRALLDVSVDGIHVTDLEGRLLDANEIFLRERGFTRAMIPSLRIEHWNAEWNREQVVARQLAMTAEPVLFETVHRRHDGTTFPAEIRGKRIELNGQPVVYCATRDVSERKGLEQRVLRSQRLESVGLIASGIAHDLNNVLTPILLSTGMLEMRYNAPEDRALLDPIEAAARRGSNIVQQILTFARGAEGQRVAVHPKILLKELSTLMRETFPRSIAHRLDLAPDVRPLVGDPTQLHQVFLNLAVNARDAMPEGGTLTIAGRNRHLTEDDLRAIPSARAGDYVCISVSDTGTGMTPDVLDHIFEPFFTTKPRGRGTGLGLSTVHGLIRSHGGFVEVDSRLGRGSEFRVFLPAAADPQAVATEAHPAPAIRLGNGEHVLVVDDEPAILTIAASVLRRHGFTPLTAADGEEGLRLFDAFGGRIAVVIADVMMPKFDGVRLAGEVRQRDARIPIIAMSGLISATPDENSRDRLRSLGVTTILEKPYGEPDLLRALTAVLGGPKSAP